MGDRLPDRVRRTEHPSRNIPAVVTRRRDVPRYEGRELLFGPPMPSSDELWRELGSVLRGRLLDVAGDVVLWWCHKSEGDRRSDVVVLGARALVIAEPRSATGPDGRLRDVYVLKQYTLDPGSFFRRDVEGLADPGGGGGRRSMERPGVMAPPPQDADLGLSDDVSGVVGNLPDDVQRLLQEPFLEGDDRIECADYYYRGTDVRLETFAIVLAGRASVTFATGSMEVPVNRRHDSAHWTLTCGRARVIGRKLPRDDS